ncbi:MAG: signal peptide peptidase SppA [Spirochaetota bacterium]
MDRNRKILVALLSLVVLSAILAIVDISITMQQKEKKHFTLQSPQYGPGVGVVRIYGRIEMTSQRTGMLGISSEADAIVERLSQLAKDSRIKAIVIRINSPGGTVAATQEIFNKIMEIRKKNITVVASMGDIAASGGYYIASACDQVFANYGTITGSIGVIIMSPDLRGLFDKLGIKMNVIKSGGYKDILSSYRQISSEERELIQELIDNSYEKFLKDVSLGRNIPISDFKQYADGRVFTGATAVEYKLVDQVGTFHDSLAKAKEIAKLPDDAAVYEKKSSPFEEFLMTMKAVYGGFMRAGGLLPADTVNNSIIEYSYKP